MSPKQATIKQSFYFLIKNFKMTELKQKVSKIIYAYRFTVDSLNQRLILMAVIPNLC